MASKLYISFKTKIHVIQYTSDCQNCQIYSKIKTRTKRSRGGYVCMHGELNKKIYTNFTLSSWRHLITTCIRTHTHIHTYRDKYNCNFNIPSTKWGNILKIIHHESLRDFHVFKSRVPSSDEFKLSVYSCDRCPIIFNDHSSHEFVQICW